MHEKFFEPWLLNLNLEDALKLWKEFPDSGEMFSQIEILLEAAKRQGSLKVKVDLESLNKMPLRFTSRNFAKAFINRAGDALVFNIIGNHAREPGNLKLAIRLGETKKEKYLVLENYGKPFGFLRPEDILHLGLM